VIASASQASPDYGQRLDLDLNPGLSSVQACLIIGATISMLT
jgi:hypothetical protein